jgi:hypothetical protein
MYLLACIASASFVFGTFVLGWWPASLDVRVALAGLYWLISTVAIFGSELLLRIQHYWISKGGRL